MTKRKKSANKKPRRKKAEAAWISSEALAERWGYPTLRGVIEAAQRLGVRSMRMGGDHAPLRFDLTDVERVEGERAEPIRPITPSEEALVAALKDFRAQHGGREPNADGECPECAEIHRWAQAQTLIDLAEGERVPPKRNRGGR